MPRDDYFKITYIILKVLYEYEEAAYGIQTISQTFIRKNVTEEIRRFKTE